MKRCLLLILFVISFAEISVLSAQVTAPVVDTIYDEVRINNNRIDSLKALLISEGVITQEEWDNIVRERNYAMDTVPVKQRESERKRKRMITNYRFVAKGDVAVGFAISFANYNTDDSQFFGMIEDFSGQISAFSTKPFVAYFYAPNSCLGVKYANTKIDADLSSLYIDIDEDLNMDFGKTGFAYALNSVALIHRSYVCLDRGHRFGLFNETALEYSWGDMNYTRTLTAGLTETNTQIQQLRIGLNPGLSVFVMDKFTVEASVGIAGFKMNRKRQTTNGIESGWRKSLGMDYKFNIFNIQIGLVAYL